VGRLICCERPTNSKNQKKKEKNKNLLEENLLRTEGKNKNHMK
jgi:hypothetical protein